ncbi:PucR family transcriptional regulator [Paenarthrobacter aurescens]|uniref:Fis family transcriptional regulator n=1 Tax=Paenarthrobacter aurescens TaxID=43663 RepID=A0A4Y3NIB0_PAEAU|nr:PucR family transcriptional regulator [Paenarthrobacter aurescens]MDO6142776.1 PucR family transcriptional regulator [Paenarthrobacter aurescens]MDO6146622.1 PucR family transcriptional regulator [Paenarthrobacter aurescens]MDO6157868.1 PucR family transcriptional regulator [Paenarthrobacter aurescens]MDO6161852.1 PucR family transcriptional regulator [Paenarthrobacter aurescens]GEB18821.1 Fis family transcriptional regulator [Paenarthrobacter aurescens]
MLPEPATARLSFVTLDQFLEQLPPELKMLHDGGSGTSLLRWVEPSELEDPTPYLPEGEFLLTAGLPFLGEGGSAAKVDAYVQRLVEAKVAALGFGIRPYFDAVPDVLLHACRKYNLTLFEVPESVPFAAIGLEFSQLLESDNARVFRQLAETNRQLMRAVLSPRPEHELLAALVQRVPVWAVLVGADGRVRARGHSTAGKGAGRQAAAGKGAGGQGAGGSSGVELSLLAPMLERLLSGSGPRVEMDGFEEPGSALVFGHPLRSTKDANLGALILGSDTPLTPAQNNVVQSAVGLLELLVRQRTSGSLAPSQLATAMLLHPESVTSGGTKHVNGLKDLLAQSLASTRSGQMRVVQGVRVDGADDGPVRELLQWRRLFDTKLVEITDYGFAAITRFKVDETLLADVEKLGWRLVIGEPTELLGLQAAYQRVSSLRGRVVATGKSARVDEVTWSVAGLLGREAGTLLAERLLSPVLALEPDRRDPLLAVLRGWLSENGSWDGSAKLLGLHRNSVRRQIGVLAELLDMDLNQAQVRAELWFALQYVDELVAGLPAGGTVG